MKFLLTIGILTIQLFPHAALAPIDLPVQQNTGQFHAKVGLQTCRFLNEFPELKLKLENNWFMLKSDTRTRILYELGMPATEAYHYGTQCRCNLFNFCGGTKK